MTTLGFLHTSPVHVATFDALTRAQDVDVRVAHAVDEQLLETARERGPAAVQDAVRAALESLVARGADLVVCTCSTIGEVAEAAKVSVPVTRVDRPMAALAVRSGNRIGVVVALESTIEPTLALLEQEARAAGLEDSVSFRVQLADGAWERFEAGDSDGYAEAVLVAARSLEPQVDVIVLAQASMAPAAESPTGISVPVLASPRVAVEHALASDPPRHRP